MAMKSFSLLCAYFRICICLSVNFFGKGADYRLVFPPCVRTHLLPSKSIQTPSLVVERLASLLQDFALKGEHVLDQMDVSRIWTEVPRVCRVGHLNISTISRMGTFPLLLKEYGTPLLYDCRHIDIELSGH